MSELIEFLICTVFLISGLLLASLLLLAINSIFTFIVNPFILLYKTVKGTQNDINF